jgi:hypothetical protein
MYAVMIIIRIAMAEGIMIFCFIASRLGVFIPTWAARASFKTHARRVTLRRPHPSKAVAGVAFTVGKMAALSWDFGPMKKGVGKNGL